MSRDRTDDAEFDWTHVHRSNFESAAFSAARWIEKGIGLYESARTLEPKIHEVWESLRARSRGESVSLAPDHFQGTYFMLMSFAVENFLKAALVHCGGHRYKNDFRSCLESGKKSAKCFPEELRTHDLFNLAVKAQLNLRESEEDLLRRLSRCAEWAGRYPSPLRFEEMSGTEKYSNGDEYSLSWFGSNDVAKLNVFVRELPKRLGLHTTYWKGE